MKITRLHSLAPLYHANYNILIIKTEMKKNENLLIDETRKTISFQSPYCLGIEIYTNSNSAGRSSVLLQLKLLRRVEFLRRHACLFLANRWVFLFYRSGAERRACFLCSLFPAYRTKPWIRGVVKIKSARLE